MSLVFVCKAHNNMILPIIQGLQNRNDLLIHLLDGHIMGGYVFTDKLRYIQGCGMAFGLKYFGVGEFLNFIYLK